MRGIFPFVIARVEKGSHDGLSEKSRSTLFQGLSEMVGEEATGEMLSYFPARDVEDPVTNEHLDLRLAELRLEMHKELNRLLAWFVTTMIAVATVAVAVATRLGH